MNALILAAGFGTRLLPLTRVVPKCLMPIFGVPLIHYWICDLLDAGVHKILINTHYKSDLVANFINEQFYKDSITLVYEKELLGTAGTMIENKDFFNGSDFLVVHGDNYTDINLKELIHFHQEFRPDIHFTLTTFFSPNPSQCGIVTKYNNILTSFTEKPLFPKSNLANCAIYSFGSHFFNTLGAEKVCNDISIDLIPNYTGDIKCFHPLGFNLDIGTHQSFFEAQSKTYKKTCPKCQLSSLSDKYTHLTELIDNEF